MSGPFMGIPGQALSARAVTPSDTTVIPTTKGLYVGEAGDIAVILQEDSEPVIFIGVSGFLPFFVTQVMATNTTADSIIALY